MGGRTPVLKPAAPVWVPWQNPASDPGCPCSIRAARRRSWGLEPTWALPEDQTNPQSGASTWRGAVRTPSCDNKAARGDQARGERRLATGREL